MKKVGLLVGVVIAVAVLFVLYARIFGFDPGPRLPGMWLTGELVTEPVTDWSFAAKVPLSAMQTRQSFFPLLAHSVTTGHFVNKGRLYFTSFYPAGLQMPAGRRWNVNAAADPHVRFRLGTRLYDATLVYVTDPAERDDVLRKVGTAYMPGVYMHLWRVEARS